MAQIIIRKMAGADGQRPKHGLSCLHGIAAYFNGRVVSDDGVEVKLDIPDERQPELAEMVKNDHPGFEAV